MGLLFSVQDVQHPPAQEDPQRAEAGEDDRERKTDLPHDLKGLVRIIPHVPAHDLIDQDPCDKLACGHKDHAPAHLSPEWDAPTGPDPLLGEEEKADPAQQEHGPVGESAEEHFKSIVERPSKSAQK